MTYRMVIEWYEPGGVFIVNVPELEGRVSQPVAEGKTRKQALQRAEDMLETVAEVARERGDPLPPPQGARIA